MLLIKCEGYWTLCDVCKHEWWGGGVLRHFTFRALNLSPTPQGQCDGWNARHLHETPLPVKIVFLVYIVNLLNLTNQTQRLVFN